MEDDFEGDGRRFYSDGPHVHEYLKELVRDAEIEDFVTVGKCLPRLWSIVSNILHHSKRAFYVF